MIIRILILLLVTANLAVGQINTEKYRTPKDFEGFTGFLEISGTYQTGNTEKKLAALESRIDWNDKNITTFLVLKTDHEYISGDLLSNNVLMHLRNMISLSEKFKTEVFAQINYDKKILIDRRELIGGGIRYKILDFDNNDFAVGTAYMYEHEIYDLDIGAVHNRVENVSRWSNYISLYLKLNSAAEFGGVLYYQPLIWDFSDTRILSENSLTVSISKSFAISVNLRIRHDSRPPDEIKDTDTQTNLGIAVKF